MEQTEREYRKVVERVQDEQFEQIQRSCSEHAIISLVTSFETYYKELLQQLLFQFPDHFTTTSTKHSTKINRLINSENQVTYEVIEDRLGLWKRFSYYGLFKTYNIEFLSPDDKEFIEYIFVKRNNYVHNAGRLDTKTLKNLEKISSPNSENEIGTEAKRLRTKLKRAIYKVHDRIIANLKGNGS